MLKDIKKYPLTYSLIAPSIFLYLVIAILSNNFLDIDINALIDMGAIYPPLMVLDNEWWRLFISIFLHGGLIHLLMNSFSLYIVGRIVEVNFSKTSYINIFFFSGLLGGIVSIYFHPLDVVIGASGAIFGIFGALAGFFIAFRKELKKNSFVNDFIIIITINLFLGLSIESIDMSAHIGGLVFGIVSGYILSKFPNKERLYFILTTILIFILIFLLNETLTPIYIELKF